MSEGFKEFLLPTLVLPAASRCCAREQIDDQVSRALLQELSSHLSQQTHLSVLTGLKLELLSVRVQTAAPK